MKKETWFVLILAAVLFVIFFYPKARGLFATLREKLGGRGSIIDGTAHKGDDSGGVLTNLGGVS